MLRDEFILYDTFRNVCTVTFVMSIIVLAIGKAGLKSAKMQYSRFTKRMMKCCYIFTAVLVLLGLFCAYQMGPVVDIMHKYKSSHHHRGHHGGHGPAHHHEATEQEQSPAEEEPRGNHNAAEPRSEVEKLFGFFGWNQDSSETPSCGYVRGADTCNAREDCAWCLSYQAPSHCAEVDHAQELELTPIFSCAKTKKEEAQAPVAKDECGYVRDITTCNDEDNCVWCKGLDAPSYCVSTDHAQDLM